MVAGFLKIVIFTAMVYKNILLVDDDAEDQEIFHTAARQASDEVVVQSFSNAKEAFAKLNNGELNPDVIFLDLNMPIMSGQEFLFAIKRTERIKEIPVIIFSTSSNESTIRHTKELGAAHYITKPNNFTALVDILKPLIN